MWARARQGCSQRTTVSWENFMKQIDAINVGEGPEWENLVSIDGVGQIMATSLVTAFQQEAERTSIDRLVNHLDVQDMAPTVQVRQPSCRKNRGVHR